MLSQQPYYDSSSCAKVIISFKLPKTFIVNLLYNFNINLRLELPHIDKIGNGKQHMLKEIMKLADKMQILCQQRVKTLIPESKGRFS